MRDVLILCMNPHAEHMYGILSGDPMAYYLFSLKHDRKVFFSTHSLPWGNLKKEGNVKHGYIYNRGKLRWYFLLESNFGSLQDVRRAGLECYVPPYRIGYKGHKRWYLLRNVRQLKSQYSDEISKKILENNFSRLKNFKFYVRGDDAVKHLQTSQLNAAICETSMQPPPEEDMEKEIIDPEENVEHLIRTDLIQSKLLEETIERAYLLKLLIRGNFPTEHGNETVVWLTRQRVLERTKGRYDVAFQLNESRRYVAIEFKKGEGWDAVNQLAGYIGELRREEGIDQKVEVLPRIVCEHRSDELVNEARRVLGPLADVEEYHLNIKFSHELK
jgi:hypothetical protein